MKMKFMEDSIKMSEYKRVKEAAKEFKTRYTDNDLVSMAYDAFGEKYKELTGEIFPYSGEILRAEVWACGMEWSEKGEHTTLFRVEVLVDWANEIDKIVYYTNLDMDIHTNATWNPFKNRNEYTFNVIRFKREYDTFMVVSDDGMVASI